MQKKHITRIASMASIALMASTAAWADVEVTGGIYTTSSNTLTLNSNAANNTVAISAAQATEINGVASTPIKVVVDRGSSGTPTYSTIVLPVDVQKDDDNITGAFLPTNFTREGSDCIVDMTEQTSLQANKPYLIAVKNNPNTLRFKTTSDIAATSAEQVDYPIKGTCWAFHGVYNKKYWEKAPTNIYGYTAQSGDGFAAGQFVKVGEDVTLYPLRAYLSCTPGSLNKSASEDELPEIVIVRLLGKNGETMSIGKMNTITGEIKMQNRYFDLNGRKINGKPQNMGFFVNKKVMEH